MDLSPETFRLILMLIGVVASNWMAVAVIRTQINHMDNRILKNESNIQTLVKETRFVLTNKEVRDIVTESVNPIASEIKKLHDDVLIMKSRGENLRTRSED